MSQDAAVAEAPASAPMTHKEILEALSGLLIAMFVAILSSTVVTNALPTIVSDLHGTQTGYTWVLVHHMLGGLRHFIWDFGYGLDKPARDRLALINIVGSVAITIVLWAIGLAVG